MLLLLEDFMMRKSVIILLLSFFGILFGGCDSGSVEKGSGKLVITSGMAPVAWLTRCIAGDKAEVRSLLPEGRSPHDYAPEPQDILAASRSRLFFSCGMPFEENLVSALKQSKVKIVDVSSGVRRIPFGDSEHHHHHDGKTHDHDCSRDGMDPHIWLSLENCWSMAKNICRELCNADPANRQFYEKNHSELEQKLLAGEKYVAAKLASRKGRSFYVYHPAFGYFAAMTGLQQVAVELGGREATPAHLADVIRRAKQDKVKVIFVQPQFSPLGMKALAKAIGGEVAEMDPLAADVLSNIKKMTDALVRGFEAEANK